MNIPTLTLAPLLLASLAVQEPATKPQEKRGLLATSDRATPGYTLFAPLQSHSTYLIDNAGQVVHEWKSDASPGQSVYLLENGHLLRAERVDSETFFGGGQGGRIREYDWDGKLVWEYVCADALRLQHHDFKRMPNGHVLLIAWEKKTRDEALAAGRDPELIEGDAFWPDMVLEIEPTLPSGGKIVWEWHAWDHLIQDLDKSKANAGDVASRAERIDLNFDRVRTKSSDEERAELERLRKLGYVGDDKRPQSADGADRVGPPGGRADWLHTNAIDYEPKLDLVLLSIHNSNELWVIDHSTSSEQAKTSKGGRHGRGGDLLVRYGNPKIARGGGEQRLFGQHDARWIASGLPGAGHVLVFNNGDRRARDASSVDELAISFDDKTLHGEAKPTIELAWTYTSPDIYATHISGAQRLANGNTLICAGETGRLVEVDAKGAVVWDYLSPLGGDAPMREPGGRGRPPMNPQGGDGRDGPPREGDGSAGPHRGPPGGFGGPGGRGPMSPNGIFRAWRYAPDYPGLAALAKKSDG
jgi:hypothetical protein